MRGAPLVAPAGGGMRVLADEPLPPGLVPPLREPIVEIFGAVRSGLGGRMVVVAVATAGLATGGVSLNDGLTGICAGSVVSTTVAAKLLADAGPTN